MARLSSAAQPSRFVEGASALVAVSPLGRVRHGSSEHGVLGIFYDTADTHASDYGIAGLWGSFSADQAQHIRALVEAARANEGYKDPLFVLFGHHPLDEMAPPSKDRLRDLIGWLDRDGAEKPDPLIEPHVIGVINAHTHLAQRSTQCIANRRLRELVVSSTIDPPQEAAWIEIGTDARGRAALRLRTLPAVERPGFTCGPALMPSAARCRSLVAGLAAHPQCEPSFWRSDGSSEPGLSCQKLEGELSLDARLNGLLRGGPSDPEQLLRGQSRRARRLLSCLCRDDACVVPPDPFKGEAYSELITTLAADPERLEELTCLAWAASAVQGHKAAGMEMADALRCAFDDPTIVAAQVSVATLEDLPCP
jgi:hypothetical protein